MNFTQFFLDCPRMTIYLDNEWIPSPNPQEVWERFNVIFGNEDIAYNASKYCTQTPLADHYIKQMKDIRMYHNDEHLLSHNTHIVRIHDISKTMTVTKKFIQSYIKDGENYEMDYCTLNIDYDPKINKEYNIKWIYSINDMVFKKYSKENILLDDNLFDSDFV